MPKIKKGPCLTTEAFRFSITALPAFGSPSVVHHLGDASPIGDLLVTQLGQDALGITAPAARSTVHRDVAIE